MKSKTKCPKCGSRRIQTTISWISGKGEKTKKGMDKRCLDCDTVICLPVDIEFYS